MQSTALLNLPGGSWNGSNIDAGWLIGGGIEYGFKAHWTLKLEYDYLTQSTWMSITAAPVSLSRDVQMIKAGINYKFESGVSEASEVSKYSREPSEDEDLAQKSQNPIADLVSCCCRSRATPISTPDRSIARRKYSTSSQSCRCT